MSVLDWIVTLSAGLLSGALGGVLSAGAITRRTEKSRDRYRAEIGIRAALNSYRALLKYDHDQLHRVSSYPESYANIKGQEAFAKEVLALAGALSKKQRDRLRLGILKLLGPTSLNWVEEHLHVPAEAMDQAVDDQRQFLVQYKAIREDPPAGSQGLISRLLRTQNDPEHHSHYQETLDQFDQLIGLITDDGNIPWWAVWRRV